MVIRLSLQFEYIFHCGPQMDPLVLSGGHSKTHLGPLVTRWLFAS